MPRAGITKFVARVVVIEMYVTNNQKISAAQKLIAEQKWLIETFVVDRSKIIAGLADEQAALSFLKLDNKWAIIEGLLGCKGEIDFVSGVKLRRQPLVGNAFSARRKNLDILMILVLLSIGSVLSYFILRFFLKVTNGVFNLGKKFSKVEMIFLFLAITCMIVGFFGFIAESIGIAQAIAAGLALMFCCVALISTRNSKTDLQIRKYHDDDTYNPKDRSSSLYYINRNF